MKTAWVGRGEKDVRNLKAGYKSLFMSYLSPSFRLEHNEHFAFELKKFKKRRIQNFNVLSQTQI